MKKLILLMSLILLTGCFGDINEVMNREGSAPFSIKTGLDSAEAACMKLRTSFNVKSSEALDVGFTPVGTTIGTAKTKIHAATKSIFESLITPGFQNVIRTVMALSIAFYGLAILLGVAVPNLYDTLMRFLKIGIILMLVSNWDFFYDTVVQFFEVITESLIAIFTDAFLPDSTRNTVGPVAVPKLDPKIKVSESFGFAYGIVDKIAYSFMTLKFWRIFLAMLFTGGQGAIYALFLLAVVFIYLLAMFRAVYMYIISLIAKALLFSMAPIFLTFLMFNQTKSLFDNWIRQIVNFSLQPILIFAFLAFFSGLIFMTLAAGFNQPGKETWVCYTAIEKIPFWQTMLTIISPLFWPLFLGKVFPFLLGSGTASSSACGPTGPLGWAVYILLLNPITLRLVVMALFWALGLLMDNMGIFQISPNWWRFVDGTDAEPIGPKFGLSYVPLDFSIFAITFILAYLMWRMGDWARDTATNLSSGIVGIQGNTGALAQPFAQAAVATAGLGARLGGTAFGMAFRPRGASAPSSDLSPDGPTVRRSTGADLSPSNTASTTTGGTPMSGGSGMGGSSTPPGGSGP